VLIYKILLPAEWAEFETAGHFEGSPFDHQSGFIHCSARNQLTATAQRVFSAEPALVIVALDAQALGDTVRWEPASNGELFPHVYGVLPSTAVTAVHQVAGASAVDTIVPADGQVDS